MKTTDKNLNTILACRYCPMCRQACPSEFINYKESDTPRGRAILMYNVYQGGKDFEASAIESIYNCFLCGACKSWCSGQELGGYDIPELVKTARRDIVSQGLAPKVIEELKDSLIAKDNSFNKEKGESFTAVITEKSAEVLYILGEGVNYTNQEIATAFIGIMDLVEESYSLLKDEPTSGKELEMLGYLEEAQEKAKILSGRIKATGCKTVVVSDPLVYDVLKNEYEAWGLGLEVKVMHTSEYLQTLIDSGKITLKQTQQKVTLADSEFLGRYNDVYQAPREVIKASAGDGLTEMQWNREYMQSAGEAAFTFDSKIFNRGNELGKKISLKAEEAGAELIVTLSAIARNNISSTTTLEVMDIAEFVSGLMAIRPD